MEGWVTKFISDVICKTKTVDPRKSPENEFLYVDVSGVSNQTLEITESTKLAGKDAPSRARRVITEGDIIFATVRPTLRRIALVPSHLNGEVCSTGYFVFQPKSELYNRYLYYFLQSDNFMGEMEKLQKGASYPAVNDSQVKSRLISYPSIPEQKQIVALLDTVFADLEQTRAKTEQNLKNARELFDSYLEQVFSQKGKGWVEDKLKSVCRLINGRAYKKPEMLSEGKYPLLRVGNFFTNRSWYYSDLELHEDKYCNNGDLLYAWSASFGPRIWEGGKTIYHYHIWKTDIDSELMLKNFLFYWFHWDATNVKKEHGAGSTMIHVSMTSMNARNISYPSIIEQKIIVDKLQNLDSKCKELEVIYNNKLTLIDELKKSILQKAFSGELTATAE